MHTYSRVVFEAELICYLEPENTSILLSFVSRCGDFWWDTPHDPSDNSFFFIHTFLVITFYYLRTLP